MNPQYFPYHLSFTTSVWDGDVCFEQNSTLSENLKAYLEAQHRILHIEFVKLTFETLASSVERRMGFQVHTSYINFLTLHCQAVCVRSCGPQEYNNGCCSECKFSLNVH